MRPSNRLPGHLKSKAVSFGERSYGAYHVDLVLSDGRVVEDVTLAWGDEVVKIAGVDVGDFDASNVVDVIDRSRRG